MDEGICMEGDPSCSKPMGCISSLYGLFLKGSLLSGKVHRCGEKLLQSSTQRDWAKVMATFGLFLFQTCSEAHLLMNSPLLSCIDDWVA